MPAIDGEDHSMTSDIQTACVAVAAGAALLRLVWIVIGKFRQLRYARRAVVVPTSWRDFCALPEPFVMAGFAWVLWRGHASAPEPDLVALASAGLAALLALLGLALSGWAFASFPSVSTGHYVLPEQHVVTSGAYGWVRHPIYLGAFLIWLGLLFAFRSPGVAVVLILYVVPAYLVYIRAEEKMLLGSLGEEYAHYQSRVGAFFPKAKLRQG
jgi:protein-S-isoprenylcysteine O-methyltransferase Ste14